MAGGGRGLLATQNISTASTWLGIGATIIGSLPQDLLSNWLSGSSGNTLMVFGAIITVVRLIDFPTLLYKLGLKKVYGDEI
jgi:hypothetical protein